MARWYRNLQALWRALRLVLASHEIPMLGRTSMADLSSVSEKIRRARVHLSKLELFAAMSLTTRVLLGLLAGLILGIALASWLPPSWQPLSSQDHRLDRVDLGA